MVLQVWGTIRTILPLFVGLSNLCTKATKEKYKVWSLYTDGLFRQVQQRIPFYRQYKETMDVTTLDCIERWPREVAIEKGFC